MGELDGDDDFADGSSPAVQYLAKLGVGGVFGHILDTQPD
ncbi:hypothetical protein CCACVL1_10889 [Corchorus capsularis]|uniref:Uncharacterized protein n=1 Tax=Corchorus capsularis TaxID=210143 RepID=A0A1R3IP16_COCAP|nr:hypothetical protein CCACVL1_10889 [Corchorus capsularis]